MFIFGLALGALVGVSFTLASLYDWEYRRRYGESRWVRRDDDEN